MTHVLSSLIYNVEIWLWFLALPFLRVSAIIQLKSKQTKKDQGKVYEKQKGIRNCHGCPSLTG